MVTALSLVCTSLVAVVIRSWWIIMWSLLLPGLVDIYQYDTDNEFHIKFIYSTAQNPPISEARSVINDDAYSCSFTSHLHVNHHFVSAACHSLTLFIKGHECQLRRCFCLLKIFGFKSLRSWSAKTVTVTAGSVEILVCDPIWRNKSEVLTWASNPSLPKWCLTSHIHLNELDSLSSSWHPHRGSGSFLCWPRLPHIWGSSGVSPGSC